MKKFRKLVEKYKKQAKAYLKKRLKEKKKIINEHNFDYDKYFDIPEGKNHPRFEDNDYKFKPHSENYAVDRIENISDKKVKVWFHFLGSKGKYEIENGEKVHYTMLAKYIGSVLCDDVVFIKKEAIANDDSVIFAIDKEAESGQKIIHMQNPEVGKITIKCKKLYAEKLDCYFLNAKEERWRKEEI